MITKQKVVLCLSMKIDEKRPKHLHDKYKMIPDENILCDCIFKNLIIEILCVCLSIGCYQLVIGFAAKCSNSKFEQPQRRNQTMVKLSNKVEPIFKGQSQTKIELFMRLLLKICYLPGILDKENRTISFKLWSRPTITHVIIYWILYLCFYNINVFMVVSIDLMEKVMAVQSFVEFVSLATVWLTIFAIFMPILIFRKIEQLDWDSLSR